MPNPRCDPRHAIHIEVLVSPYPETIQSSIPSIICERVHSSYRVRVADDRALHGSLRDLDAVQRAAIAVKEYAHAVLQQSPEGTRHVFMQGTERGATQ